MTKDEFTAAVKEFEDSYFDYAEFLKAEFDFQWEDEPTATIDCVIFRQSFGVPVCLDDDGEICISNDPEYYSLDLDEKGLHTWALGELSDRFDKLQAEVGKVAEKLQELR